jgi:murein DD-endopeptidase MepM/ murein hydrolase activator NlpD
VRVVIFSLFISGVLLFGASTTQKIEQSKQELQKSSLKNERLNDHLEDIARDIAKAEKEIDLLDQEISKLSLEYQKTSQESARLKSEIEQSKVKMAETQKSIEKKRADFIALLAEQFSISFAIERIGESSVDSVMLTEIYKGYKIHNQKVLAELNSDIRRLEAQKKNQLKNLERNKESLAKILKMKETLVAKKDKKNNALALLERDERAYKKQLEDAEKEQNSLRATLSKLNIIRNKEIEDAKRREEMRLAAIRSEEERKKRLREQLSNAREKGENVDLSSIEDSQPSKKVRQVNSSYTPHKTYNYSGAKTISPIDNAKIVKKFGTYVDPIYKIKVFNESITLKAPSRDANVKNVLHGKVVFAGESSMLGNVVVIAHDNNMHTIYAGLSKIAPTIKTGVRIKQGYIVGKVASKLIFEATKDSFHIDPTKLIRV